MSLLKIEKTSDWKKINFLGMSIKLKRSRMKKGEHLYRKIPDSLKNEGVSLVANFSEINGESVVANSVLSALKMSDIPFDYTELNGQNTPMYKNKITFTTSYYYKPDIYNNVSVLFWEFESGMPQVRPYVFEKILAVITFSNFCANYFKSIVPKGIAVIKLPYPFVMSETDVVSESEVRKSYGIKNDDFVCFFNFSYMSSYYRKNPEAVLSAFANALGEFKNTRLIVKTISSPKVGDYAEKFRQKIIELGLENKVIVIDRVLPKFQMMSLINCCDVYISLHRGEGLGLGMMEAMALGKPVVATNYGGNTEFIKEGVALPVGYTLVKPQQVDIEEYKYVELWAEPDVEEASRYLKELYKNPDMCKRIGDKAAAYIAKEFNPKRFVSEMRRTLL